MKHVRLPCGCVYEHGRERWTKLCEKHQAEYDEIHARWAAERAARETPDAAL